MLRRADRPIRRGNSHRIHAAVHIDAEGFARLNGSRCILQRDEDEQQAVAVRLQQGDRVRGKRSERFRHPAAGDGKAWQLQGAGRRSARSDPRGYSRWKVRAPW